MHEEVHNGHQVPRQVWAVYYQPTDAAADSPAVFFTIPVPLHDDAPCRYCKRTGAEGPCPGPKAHAFAQHARLSDDLKFLTLEVDLFTLPPHVSPYMCANNLFSQIVKRGKEKPGSTE